MDIWVDRTADNYSRILLAFHQFGMPVFDMTEDNFLNHPMIWRIFNKMRMSVWKKARSTGYFLTQNFTRFLKSVSIN
jgi:hypothetical protein